ncbi:MAG: hypothetical protein DRP56_06710 [Planctomycetota bacterium]|nr:MAG: hypothetical protein DRP56_06710 [Planctomycetota bacterium]RKY10858.1 MAG: hypothetical protein DRP52_06755 [Planctomycetota bacterium]
MTNPLTWISETKTLGELIPRPDNPRFINEAEGERLIDSYFEFGQPIPLLANPDGTLNDGHQRLKKWIEKFGPEFKADLRIPSRPLTQKEWQKLTVYLHRGTTGQFDFEMLKGWEIDEELIGWGFDTEELVLQGFEFEDDAEAAEDHDAQVDKAEELLEKWGVERGQIWQCGRHRVMCGDSTNAEDVGRLMEGEVAEMMWTDPPYGVEYVGGVNGITIKNDKANVLPELLKNAFDCADSILQNGAAVYIAHPPGALSLVFGNIFVATGWHFHENLVWVKNLFVFGHCDYHLRHEGIFYGWKGKNRKWYGERNKDSVFEIDRPSRNAYHPTMKPLSLIVAHILNSSREKEIVYDAFCGSGSTLIVCEQINRIGYGMEIAPKYAAVIIERLCNMGLNCELLKL